MSRGAVWVFTQASQPLKTPYNEDAMYFGVTTWEER